MRKWEYIQVHVSSNRFAVTSPQGTYLSEDQYRSMDTKGKKVVEDEQWDWEPGIGPRRFLLMLLNILGGEGWELIGTIKCDELVDQTLILKRRTGKTKG